MNNFAFHPLIFHFGQIDSAFALDPADETHSDHNVHYDIKTGKYQGRYVTWKCPDEIGLYVILRLGFNELVYKIEAESRSVIFSIFLSNVLDSLRSRSWYGEPVLLGSCPEDDPRPIRRTGSEDIGLTQNPQPRDHVCVLRVLLLVHVFGEAPE